MQAISQELRKFIVDNFLFGQNDQKLSDRDSFLERGIIDSTGVLELITFLEEHYQIKIDDTEVLPENLDSIHAVTRFLERKRSASVVKE